MQDTWYVTPMNGSFDPQRGCNPQVENCWARGCENTWLLLFLPSANWFPTPVWKGSLNYFSVITDWCLWEEAYFQTGRLIPWYRGSLQVTAGDWIVSEIRFLHTVIKGICDHANLKRDLYIASYTKIVQMEQGLHIRNQAGTGRSMKD